MTGSNLNQELGTRNQEPVVFVLVGATASGKTDVAVELARLLGAELASMDSMKVYRGMDIGTAKPAAAERAGLRWHLLDLVEPSEEFNVGRWLEAADRAIAEAAGRGAPIVFEGGSPLYCRALLYGLFPGPPRDAALRAALRARAEAEGVEKLHAELAAVDPAAAAKIGARDIRRIERALEVWRLTGRPISAEQRQFGQLRSGYDFRLAGVERPRAELYRRIDSRVEAMMAAGFLEEVRALLAAPERPSREALQALGYRELSRHLAGEIPLDEAVYLTKRNTRHFARRQLGAFRKIPGFAWLSPTAERSSSELAAGIPGLTKPA
ncbi:MAG TPA: tRNA (adenosine(37)-N6)-dimethylallyltransferase MiaA [Planctomycetota bacterium]|nr:tRNA (adenosine(37)-N6)-dimethylallyltransferase MiaA [Planctomycetota bacterium]